MAVWGSFNYMLLEKKTWMTFKKDLKTVQQVLLVKKSSCKVSLYIYCE